MILALLLACDEGTRDGAAIDLTAFAALEDDRAWTWRDDLVTDTPPAASLLLHGRLDGDGLALRRGDRWEDATDAGRLGLRHEDGLWLDGWTVEGEGDPSTLQLAEESPPDGGSVTSDGHTCSIQRVAPFTTWYATFDPVAEIACDTGLTMILAQGFGAVWMSDGSVTLDLVAPY